MYTWNVLGIAGLLVISFVVMLISMSFSGGFSVMFSDIGNSVVASDTVTELPVCACAETDSVVSGVRKERGKRREEYSFQWKQNHIC